MASVQCYQSYEESCQQKSQQQQHHSSFGQKVSELFKGHHHHPNGGTQTETAETQCYSQTQLYSQPGHVANAKTQTECSYTQTQTTHGGRSRRKEHKRNLLQKIKDGLSGHNSDSSCSSDSESDNEKCEKSKN